MNKHHKVLIVGTVPYNKNTTSRAFDAYFHNWEKENIRQIFSNTKTPPKGHCASLYQITDQRLLKKRIGTIKETGKIFQYNELPEDWTNNDLEVNSAIIERLYKIGSKDRPIKHLLRKWLWNKRYWESEQLREWLDDFRPECVFIAFSDDFFILEIALYIANKYNIPIISCIGDDYYFNNRFSVSPFYYVYRYKYKKLVRKVFQHKGSAIYISDKIRDKYNKEFGLNGETVYLTSEIKRHDFKQIDKENPRITYVGNIRLGRNKSLAEIGEALSEINKKFKIEVYTTERSNKYINSLKDKKGIDFRGAIPYSSVSKIMSSSDINIIVEGFSKKDEIATKYSLSTKAADAISVGGQIFVYGSKECGVVEYMESTKCAVVCTKKLKLKEDIMTLITDERLQKKLYLKSNKIMIKNHNLNNSLKTSESIISRIIEKD